MSVRTSATGYQNQSTPTRTAFSGTSGAVHKHRTVDTVDPCKNKLEQKTCVVLMSAKEAIPNLVRLQLSAW